MTIAADCYGRKGSTSIEEAREGKYFRARVARRNTVLSRGVSRNPWKSTAKKWLEYYAEDPDECNAVFTFYADADPAEVAKKATILQKLGAEVRFEETDNA